jgi:hypothetical protein
MSGNICQAFLKNKNSRLNAHIFFADLRIKFLNGATSGIISLSKDQIQQGGDAESVCESILVQGRREALSSHENYEADLMLLA